MTKIFKFDAIGRDLFPGERQAARAFVSKYESPPSKADAQRQMRTVMGRVLRTSAQVKASASTKTSATVNAGSRAKVATGAKVQAGAKVRSTSALIAKGSVKRAAKG